MVKRTLLRNEHLFCNVFGDSSEGINEEGEWEVVDVLPPWPVPKLREEIKRILKDTSDIDEQLDLNQALCDLYHIEKCIESGHSELAALFGISVGRLLSRYEVRSRRRHHALGGKATKKLTADQEELARTIIAEKRVGLGTRWKRAACVRAAAELKSKHGIEVSKETLLRLLRNQV